VSPAARRRAGLAGGQPLDLLRGQIAGGAEIIGALPGGDGVAGAAAEDAVHPAGVKAAPRQPGLDGGALLAAETQRRLGLRRAGGAAARLSAGGAAQDLVRLRHAQRAGLRIIAVPLPQRDGAAGAGAEVSVHAAGAVAQRAQPALDL